MKKYLVDIYMPACGEHYDVYLPACKRIDEVTNLLAGIIESLSSGSYKNTGNAIMLHAYNGEPIKHDITVYDAGIRNASKLIFI